MSADLQIATSKIASLNPATGELLREFECASEREIHDAVFRTRTAQTDWAEIGLRRRIEIIQKFSWNPACTNFLLPKSLTVTKFFTLTKGQELGVGC